MRTLDIPAHGLALLDDHLHVHLPRLRVPRQIHQRLEPPLPLRNLRIGLCRVPRLGAVDVPLAELRALGRRHRPELLVCGRIPGVDLPLEVGLVVDGSPG